jgi:hypothetical protein
VGAESARDAIISLIPLRNIIPTSFPDGSSQADETKSMSEERIVVRRSVCCFVCDNCKRAISFWSDDMARQRVWRAEDSFSGRKWC